MYLEIVEKLILENPIQLEDWKPKVPYQSVDKWYQGELKLDFEQRISDGLKAWRPLFDPLYNPLKPTAFSAASVPKIVDDLQAEADKRVLVPMFEANGTVDVNGLKQFRDNTLRNDKKWTLSPFVAEPKLTLPKR